MRGPLVMDIPTKKTPFVWQPLTPRGVGDFARASLSRLLLVQLVVAMWAAVVVVWFLNSAWFPAIGEAIHHLPPTGEIRAGSLNWDGDSPLTLADGRFLAFTVDLKHEGGVRSPAHVQVEFGKTDFQVFSLFGFASGEYLAERMPFNRPELEPWWGAWVEAILGIVALAVMGGLFVCWMALATVYAVPAWLLAFFADRQLNLRGSWKLAGAALMPGALVMTVGIIFYGLGVLDLVQLVVWGAAHFVVAWVYLVVSALSLPRRPELVAARSNPFDGPATEPAKAVIAAPSAKNDPPLLNG